MRKKLFTFLLALVTSVGLSWADNPAKLYTEEKPSWVREGDDWDDATKTLTVNSDLEHDVYANVGVIQQVVISSGVTSIEDLAFYKCKNIEAVTIPNSVTSIGMGALGGCSSLTSVVIPNSVTSLAGIIFVDCTGLISVTIPNSVTRIGQAAFQSCTGLTSITIPSSVTDIENDAFNDCTSMDDVYCYPLAADLTWGNTSADFKANKATRCHVFADQLSAYETKFATVNVTFVGDLPAPTPSWVRDGDDWDDATKTLTVNSDLEESAYNGQTEIQHVIISNGVTSIGQTAFNNCFNLSSVTIPNSVTSIEFMAFGSCEKLSSVTIPNGVTRIEGGTFASCYNLSSVTIPNSVTIIKDQAFASCYGLTSIEIPNSVDSIGMSAFSICDGLTSVTIPSSVTFIDMMAFMYCSNLTTVTCEAVTPPNLGDFAFDESPLLAHIYVPAGSVSAYKSAWSAYEALIEANPVLPTVYLYLNGSADAFTNRGDGTASYDYHFSSTGSYKEFKIRLGESDWRSNGATFNPEHTTYDWINDNGGGAYMKIYIDAEADYTFTWTYAENKLEITHPVVPDYTVMTKVDPENPGVYYSTFYSSNYSYKLMDDGTVAFIAKISSGDLVLTQIAEGEQVIPAGTAVIFRKTGSSLPIGLRDTEENNTSFDPDDNDLEGVNVATPVTDIPGLTVDNCYVLSGMSHDESVKGVGFYKIYGSELKQHKAYVKYAGSQNNAPKKMRFVYGQATSIEDVQGNNVQSTKVIENGVLYIIRDGKTYNAMGQVVK